MEKELQEFDPAPSKYTEDSLTRKPIRKEVHTRTTFAHNQGALYYSKMKHVLSSGGNIMTSKLTKKFLKARKIYIHYTQEYQTCQQLPLTT